MTNGLPKATTAIKRFSKLTPVEQRELEKSEPAVYEQVYRDYCAWLRPHSLANLWVFISQVLRNPVLYEPLHKPLSDWLSGGRGCGLNPNDCYCSPAAT